MLTFLQVSDFTLVNSLDLDFDQGLSVITGETGAGKSILLDALSLAVGERGDANKVKKGCDKADVKASFDVSAMPSVQAWLEANDFPASTECLLRRVITAEGRSRAFVNGHTVTLQQLRQLGSMLLDIHGQHEHQTLLKPSRHAYLLDEFGGLQALAAQVKGAYSTWNKANKTLKALENRGEEINARYQLLHYQVEELEQLALQEGETSKLEAELKELSNAGTLHEHCQSILDLCHNEGGLDSQLHQSLQLLSHASKFTTHLKNSVEMMENARILINETQAEVESYLAQHDVDPSRLTQVEERLSSIYSIARKHRVSADDLVSLHENLKKELDTLKCSDEQLESFKVEREHAELQYQQLANELSDQRQFAAARLGKEVNSRLHLLSMDAANFTVKLTSEQGQPSASGADDIEFLISTIPGQAPMPLGKIASGGELSRVSLAIQVATAQTTKAPTLVFDEVDVGIGGETGDVVGRMLRELGAHGQVVCVTHLAQVASKAHQHLHVSKTLNQHSAKTEINYLSKQEKVKEIARMMGGACDSKTSIAHARQMIKSA